LDNIILILELNIEGRFQQVQKLEGYVASISSVAFSSNRRWLALTSHSRTIKVWETNKYMSLDYSKDVAENKGTLGVEGPNR
jgi:WD40 repeat protein